MNLGLRLGVTMRQRAADRTPAAPVIESVTITGNPVVGETLGVAVSRTGYPTPALTYVWKLEGTPIGGATASTYTPVEGDVGDELTVTVTATNTEGSDSDTIAGVTITAAAEAPTFDSDSITFDDNTHTFDEAA